MNRNGLKIGEFSRLCRLTVRALRHCQKIKLLVPEIIDYSTGYRYYSVVQMQKALNIVRLKGLGFSLEEIRTMYDSETHRPSINMLEEKIRSCREQLRLLTKWVWWNWNEIGRVVLNRRLRYLPHITIGIGELIQSSKASALFVSWGYFSFHMTDYFFSPRTHHLMNGIRLSVS